MARNTTFQDISWFLDMYKNDQLDLDPPYQRLSVWSSRDKSFFIDTILNNYPAPPIFLHKTTDENGRVTYHVIDGKQRLLTIIEFTENLVRIPGDFNDVNLQKKKWEDLDPSTKQRFWDYGLLVEILPNVNGSEIRNIFERINRNSRNLTAQELRHAKYDGWFINFVESEAEKNEWKTFGIVTPARKKRMRDVQFLSELAAVVLKGELLGFDQDNLNKLYAEYDDISEDASFVEDDFYDEFERIKSNILELTSLAPQIKKYLKAQSHFYTLWSYIHLEQHQQLDNDIFAARYFDYMESVFAAVNSPNIEEAQFVEGPNAIWHQAVIDYAKNYRGATTDLAPRRKRHIGLVGAIHGHEAITHEDH